MVCKPKGEPRLSHRMVSIVPTIIETIPPIFVTFGQTKAAMTAGVIPAPYIVYDQCCIARIDGKN